MPRTPRFTAYTLVFPPGCAGYVFGQYGFQTDAAEKAEHRASAAAGAFTGAHAPDVLDRGSFTDSAGRYNAVWYAYWLAPAAHRRWVAAGGRKRARAGVPPLAGHWWEEATVPVGAQSALQTHRTADFPVRGLASVLPQRVQDIHDYWGAVRDRIPIPDRTVHAAPTVRVRRRGESVHLSVDGGLCVIRTAQDWTLSTVYRDRFLQDVAPVMRRGVDYLQQHPADSGCVAARDVREHDAHGTPLERASVLAWFDSLQAMLDWTRDHPIYEAFFEMLGTDGTPLDVALWNEVATLPPGSVTAAYTHCHDRTGFLPLLGEGTLR
ncbi:hypothetical protein CTZ27_11650 [Streptomyces griseocarneus]|nr:hypothetical protein CTZ27_11650 [Streptomyces griseocarneus]